MAAEGREPLNFLSKAWYNLRLSVRCPSRVPTWDAVILTAASPDQASLYQWHLDIAKRRGRIEASTIAIAVPDPQGCRIGSGGATLHAIRSLARHLITNRSKASAPIPSTDELSIEASIDGLIFGMSVLLVHAGGDSKRVPWANPMGKAFLPLPFLAGDDPDGPTPSLFDHILAISSCAVQNFKKKGGMLIMTGDVLPCFDLSDFYIPEDGACVVTVPAALDIAANHGVILASSLDGIIDFSCLGEEQKLEIVMDLLQKPSVKELMDSGAVKSEGTVLLDTGIFAVRGKAWSDLIKLALEDPDPVLELLHHGQEVSLYEEMAGSWVPARREWLRTRPLGTKLINALSSQPLFSYCAQELSFLHFGTSIEVLNHLAKDHGGRVGRRHMIFPAEDLSHKLASSALIVSTEIDDTVFVGEQSLVFDCAFHSGVHVGCRCIVVGIRHKNVEAGTSFWGIEQTSLLLPDGHCLWEVPLRDTESRVTPCCSIEDNPKCPLTKRGTFCGKLWECFLREMGFEEEELWPCQSSEQKNLWGAKLFPVLPPGQGVSFAMWLMGIHKEQSDEFLSAWRRCERVSLAELHSCIDFKRLCEESSHHHAKLSLEIAKASLSCGLLDRDLSKLSAQIVEGFDSGAETCRELMALCPDPESVGLLRVPVSRVYQAHLDLFRVCGDDMAAAALENNVWDAVAAETAIAVGQKSSDSCSTTFKYTSITKTQVQPYLDFPVRKSKVELPVRLDIVGGWSDTPPWSLERIGTVLNMAIHLEGSAPIGAEVTVTLAAGISISDDAGNHLTIDDPTSISSPFHIDDPFRLVKCALLVTGLATTSNLWHGGVEVKTWANVPRGSGLGTSSILAAAVVKGLLQVMGGDDSNQNVASLVLVLEQLMGTGGGWQDQIGGLYPGIKYTTSFPGQSLMLKVEPVLVTSHIKRELEERMLVVFTGQVRLAHEVLQNVVRRYLQRDAVLISTIKQLTHLAHLSQEALIVGNLDKLGKIMREAWLLHQELDPHCSNTFVDKIFKQVDDLTCGYKLVGAGGGGFGVLMAKDREAALCVKEVLKGLPVEVYNWSLCMSNSFDDL